MCVLLWAWEPCPAAVLSAVQAHSTAVLGQAQGRRKGEATGVASVGSFPHVSHAKTEPVSDASRTSGNIAKKGKRTPAVAIHILQ